jgi:predicted SprT family Zn-dependent metalloprotease
MTTSDATQASEPVRELESELERAVVRELRYAYDDLNAKFFARRLQRPLLELTPTAVRLGRWVPARRSLELSRSLLFDHAWGVLVEVLKHEMAHQYVNEVMGLWNEPAHGPAFREVCAARGIDARASGLPAQAAVRANDEQAKVLDRVAKLLALAESPNEHEAQVAMSTAQRLMLKYNIDVALRGSGARYGFRHLGLPTGRVTESQRILGSLLDEHFFVQVIWVNVWRPLAGKRGKVLEVCGAPENLDLAAYVHDFLTHTAERLWSEHKRRRGVRKNAERRYYVAGVMAGFRDKLQSERRRSSEEGLVWVGDAELERYFRQRHPRIRWDSYGRVHGTDAYARGRDAGRRIVLHRGLETGPSGTLRLLPGRRGSG